MIAVAAAVAGKLTESVAAGAKAALSTLVRAVRNRLAADDQARRALAEADAAPADGDRVAALAGHLERLAAEDAGFAEQLRGLWSQTDARLQAHRGGTVNEVSGTVSGHVVQARDIDGGVKFGPTP